MARFGGARRLLVIERVAEAERDALDRLRQREELPRGCSSQSVPPLSYAAARARGRTSVSSSGASIVLACALMRQLNGEATSAATWRG